MKIVLVNDNPMVQKLVTLSAQKTGHDLKCVVGVDELTQGDGYDLLIINDTSYTPELLQTLKERVVFKVDTFLATHGMETPSGFDYTLNKPFLPVDMMGLLSTIFASERFNTPAVVEEVAPLSIQGSVEEAVLEQKTLMNFGSDEFSFNTLHEESTPVQSTEETISLEPFQAPQGEFELPSMEVLQSIEPTLNTPEPPVETVVSEAPIQSVLPEVALEDDDDDDDLSLTSRTDEEDEETLPITLPLHHDEPILPQEVIHHELDTIDPIALGIALQEPTPAVSAPILETPAQVSAPLDVTDVDETLKTLETLIRTLHDANLSPKGINITINLTIGTK